MNFEEVVVYSMSICIVGDFYTIVVVVKVCMLIVNNCKSYVIEKFCIVCYNYKDNYCEHADLNVDGDVDGDGDDDEDNSTNHFSYSDGNDYHKCNSFYTGQKERLTLVFFVRTIKSNNFYPIQRVSSCGLNYV